MEIEFHCGNVFLSQKKLNPGLKSTGVKARCGFEEKRVVHDCWHGYPIVEDSPPNGHEQNEGSRTT
jgi:hypothetical protein